MTGPRRSHGPRDDRPPDPRVRGEEHGVSLPDDEALVVHVRSAHVRGNLG